jgi:hypothetical protein
MKNSIRLMTVTIAATLCFTAPVKAETEPVSQKRPTYGVVQMQLRPITYRLAANARRLSGIRVDLARFAKRPQTGDTVTVDAETIGNIHTVMNALTELSVRIDHQVELMELTTLIEIESKHDFFMRRLDQLHVTREIAGEITDGIESSIPKIQNNAALRLIERAKFVIGNTTDLFNSGIETISALEPAIRAGK